MASIEDMMIISVGFLPPPPIIVYLFGEEGFDLRPGDEKGVEVRQPVLLCKNNSE